MKKVLLFKLLVLGALVIAGCSDTQKGDSSEHGLLGDDNVTVTVGDGSRDGNSTVNDDGTKGGDTNGTGGNGDTNSINGSGNNNGTNGNGGTDGNTIGGGGNSGNTNTTNSNDDNTTLSEIKSINLK